MRAIPEAPLWLTVRGASAWTAVGWLTWVAGVALVATVTGASLGPAGPVLAVLAVGWLLARNHPAPTECLRRYHLDDEELVILGPGRRVRRLRWADVEVVSEQRRALCLVAAGTVAYLPRAPLVAVRALVPVLRRVMPVVAEALWDHIETRIVRLVPNADPPSRALAWWAYAPAVLASAAAGAAPGLAVLLALACGERGLALARARRHAVTLHAGGVAVADFFAPWTGAATMPWPGGLRVVVPSRAAALVPDTLPNFWAAAAVIQLRALLGPACSAEVYFRVHAEGDELSVVGEVEAETVS
jgi:hypothetical protein